MLQNIKLALTFICVMASGTSAFVWLDRKHAPRWPYSAVTALLGTALACLVGLIAGVLFTPQNWLVLILGTLIIGALAGWYVAPKAGESSSKEE